MGLVLITAPAAEPVTLAEAKDHLNITTGETDKDTLISALITAARQHLDGRDGILGRALVSQTWDFYQDYFPANGIRIPLPPLQSVSYVKYLDTDNVLQTLVADTDYTVDTQSEPGWVMPNATTGWPATYDTINAVRVRFVAGYADSGASPVDLADTVPMPIKQAILLLVGHWFDHREASIAGTTIGEIPLGVDRLINPHRIWSFG